MIAYSCTRQEKLPSYADLSSALIERYGAPAFEFTLRDQIRLLERSFPDPATIKGKRILDLGCGCDSGSAETKFDPRLWSPWLCRAVDYLGGHAVGVDLGFLTSADNFEFHRIDLSSEGALAKFPGQSFDGVSCSNLLSSPHLVLTLGKSRETRELMGKHLKAEAQRLLKPSGVLIAFDERLDNH